MDKLKSLNFTPKVNKIKFPIKATLFGLETSCEINANSSLPRNNQIQNGKLERNPSKSVNQPPCFKFSSENTVVAQP